MVRRQQVSGDAAFWDPDAGVIDAAAIEGVDAVVHLAGAGIERRWSARGKQLVLDSRVRGTRLLAETLARSARPPGVLVSASAVGWYGDRGDDVLTEADGPGSGFLAEVCRAWEGAAQPAVDAGIRVVNMRTGVVLHPSGGMLRRLLLPFRLGLGGRMGSGGQYVSWITLDDHVGAIRHALRTPELRGPVNFVGPHPVTNRDLTRELGRALRRPTMLPVPVPLVRLAYGRQLVDELMLASQRALPARLEASGYRFDHPDLPGALASVLAKVDRGARGA